MSNILLAIASAKEKLNLCWKNLLKNTRAKPKLFNGNNSAWNQKDPQNKNKESNLESEGRLESSLTINDGNACSTSFFSNIETLNPLIYCSCHPKGCLYPTQPYNYIIECIYNLTILVQIYIKYIEAYWFQPDPQHKHSKNLAPKRRNKSNPPGI